MGKRSEAIEAMWSCRDEIVTIVKADQQQRTAGDRRRRDVTRLLPGCNVLETRVG
jgi:hypothetical protein